MRGMLGQGPQADSTLGCDGLWAKHIQYLNYEGRSTPYGARYAVAIRRGYGCDS